MGRAPIEIPYPSLFDCIIVPLQAIQCSEIFDNAVMFTAADSITVQEIKTSCIGGFTFGLFMRIPVMTAKAVTLFNEAKAAKTFSFNNSYHPDYINVVNKYNVKAFKADGQKKVLPACATYSLLWLVCNAMIKTSQTAAEIKTAFGKRVSTASAIHNIKPSKVDIDVKTIELLKTNTTPFRTILGKLMVDFFQTQRLDNETNADYNMRLHYMKFLMNFEMTAFLAIHDFAMTEMKTHAHVYSPILKELL